MGATAIEKQDDRKDRQIPVAPMDKELEGRKDDCHVSALVLYGDVLESVVVHVPTADLLPASRVSREWRRAVRSALRRHPRRAPWLLLRHLCRPSSAAASLHVYDPHSQAWLSHKSPTQKSPVCFLYGSGGNRLFNLSLSNLMISDDPFGITRRVEMKAPKVWRDDPVVAMVGQRVVVAGGGCAMALSEGEEIGAVEVYNKESDSWTMCEAFPAVFDGSVSATWLSAAASGRRLYVIERKTGWASWFDPQFGKWGATCQLKPDTKMSNWAIAFGMNESLILLGVGKEHGLAVEVKVWEIIGDTMLVIHNKDEETMPQEMVRRLFPYEEGDDDTWQCFPIAVCGTEYGGYVYNRSGLSNGAAFYELSPLEERDEGKGKGNTVIKRWEWVPYPPAARENLSGKVVLGCSPVGLHDLATLSLH